MKKEDKKNFEWIQKEGENWKVLVVKDSNKLTLEQSLKVQEMVDNKNNQEKQIKILERQEKISEKQNIFNELLAVATVVLAFGYILTFFKFQPPTIESSLLIIIIGIFSLILFFTFAIFLIVIAYKYLIFKAEKNKK